MILPLLGLLTQTGLSKAIGQSGEPPRRRLSSISRLCDERADLRKSEQKKKSGEADASTDMHGPQSAKPLPEASLLLAKHMHFLFSLPGHTLTPRYCGFSQLSTRLYL